MLENPYIIIELLYAEREREREREKERHAKVNKLTYQTTN